MLHDSRIRQLLSSHSFVDEEDLQCVPFSSSLSTVQGRDGQARKQCSVSMHVLPGGEGGGSGRGLPASLGTVSVEATLADKTASSNKFDRVAFSSVLFRHGAKGVIWKIDFDSLQNIREINV